MDYEQKYKEALKVMEGLYNVVKYQSSSDALFASQTIEKAFHELKESEDEKIRKAIHIYLDWLDGRKDVSPRGEYTLRDMIAWLEKQGEKKSDPRYDIIEELIEADDICQMSRNDAMDAEAKQKAISSLSKLSISELLGFEKQSEQKTAWSEEDEEALRSVTEVFRVSGTRFLHYPAILNWLKSLKPRWKPTEEQMEALEHFVRSIGESGYASPYDNNTKHIYSLLNDLKSL